MRLKIFFFKKRKKHGNNPMIFFNARTTHIAIRQVFSEKIQQNPQ